MDYTLTIMVSGNEAIIIGESIGLAASFKGAGLQVSLAEVVAENGTKHNVMPHHENCSLSGYIDSDGVQNPPSCHPDCIVS